MQRYFLQLSYDGANYHGWQIQPNGTSVEETIEKSLSTLLRQPIDITGAGRTDTGVNASMMVAHFDADESIVGDCGQLAYRLNRILPRDIAIQKIKAVDSENHAHTIIIFTHGRIRFSGDIRGRSTINWTSTS